MKTGAQGTYPEQVVEKGVLFLLIFTPLAIGTVQPWSTAVMELVSFTVFGAWILTLWHKQEIKIVLPPFLIAAAGLVLLVLLQLVPMPDSILAALSPATTRLYQQLSLPGDVSWRTISIRPEATWEELYKVLAYAAIFTVIINHYRTREQVSALVRAIVLIGTGLAFFGVLQKMTWNGNLFWIYPIREGLLPMGPYINRNHFAGYLEMAIPLGLGLILDRSARMGSYKQLPLLSRINAVLGDRYFPAIVFLSLAVLVMTGALFLSLSRGGMIGWSAGLFAFAMLARSKRSIRKRIVVIAGVGLAVLVLVVIAGWSRIEHRFEELGDEGSFKRAEVWRDSIGIVRDFPVWGTGLATFDPAYLRYQRANPGLIFDHAHNDYLEVATDLGLAGIAMAAALLALFAGTITRAWRTRHSRFVTSIAAGCIASCVALAVHSMTDFNLHIPANALLATVIAALCYSVLVHVQNGVLSRSSAHD